MSAGKVAVVWRGDQGDRAQARAETSRLKAIFDALAALGISAEPAVFVEAAAEDLRAQLLGMDGVLVWVDPISTTTGERRGVLDGILREATAAGVMVSAHPDVIDQMGVKAVLYRTRDLGWGCDTHFYETRADFEAGFPGVLASGSRVLKQNRGNGGIGVWRVEGLSGAKVRVLEARRDSTAQTIPLETFMDERGGDLETAGGLIDQPFQARHLDGMIRCYMAGGRVAGFGHQMVRALARPQDGPASPRLYSGPEDARFQRLRTSMETDWTPGLVRRLGLRTGDLPVIWDADFLLGPRGADGEDSYVLCEINASSVFPIPEEAPAAIAALTLRRLRARRDGAADGKGAQ